MTDRDAWAELDAAANLSDEELARRRAAILALANAEDCGECGVCDACVEIAYFGAERHEL